MIKVDHSQFYSINLISLEHHFDNMTKWYDSGFFPKVLLLNGKKGIGKFTLVMHFLNYIFSKNEKKKYDLKNKLINVESIFYNSILNQTTQDVIFFKAEEGKNLKIEDIRNLKSILSKTSLSNEPRFIIIDEVEFLNQNSANALLKTLEEPNNNNNFILINNQQAELMETISSRCLKNNIYVNFHQRKKIIDHLFKNKEISITFDDNNNLTPGILLNYNDLIVKYKIIDNENIASKINKLLNGYKKDRNKALINMSFFLIDHFFYLLINAKKNRIEFLLNTKSTIINKINDFVLYNLNIKSVINFIDLKLKYVS